MESNSGRRFGGIMQSWSDGMNLQPASSSPLLSFVSTHHDGNADNVVYKNLVEMFPLVDTLMDQTSKPYQKHTSFLVYTPPLAPLATLPSRDAANSKKAIDLNPFKGKKSRKGKKGRYFLNNRADMKDGISVDNVQNLLIYGNQEPYLKDISRLSFSMDLEVDQNAMIVQLKSRIDELEQGLLDEKINKFQAEEKKNKEAEQVELQREIGELQKKLLIKEEEVEKALLQISEKEEKITCMHSLLEKAEDNVHTSNLNMMKFHEESHRLHYQVAEFLFQMESITASNDVDLDPDHHEPENLTREETDNVHEDVMACESEAEHAELTSRKYLGSLIAARVNPSEEMLSLVSMLRSELQRYSMQ